MAAESIVRIHYHFVWECATEGRIKIQFVGMNDQLADIVTKPLPPAGACRAPGACGTSQRGMLGSEHVKHEVAAKSASLCK
jgi:hypothetical protein